MLLSAGQSPRAYNHRQPKLTLRGKGVIYLPYDMNSERFINLVTRDLSARRVGVALQATVENKRLCMRNKILRSANAKEREI